VAARRVEEGWIEGARPVLEALRSGRRRVLEVWVPEKPAESAVARELVERARAIGARMHAVERAADVRARAEPLVELSFEELLVQSAPPRFLVALDGVTDVGNFGSIARSAETAGVNGLIVELRRSPGLTPAALRVSSGAFEHLALARTPNLVRAIDLARFEGTRILVADMDGEPLESLDPEQVRGDLIWIFGAEDRGVRAPLVKRADLRVAIPMYGKLGSLGVAAAAAVLMHRTAGLRARPG